MQDWQRTRSTPVQCLPELIWLRAQKLAELGDVAHPAAVAGLSGSPEEVWKRPVSKSFQGVLWVWEGA